MVPVHKEHRKVSAIRKLWGKVSFNYTKLKWMGLCIALPEYVLGKALTECLAAHDSRRQFKEWSAANDTRKRPDVEVAHAIEEEPEEEAWTTAHGFFANMRGFVLRFDVAAVRTPLEPSKPTVLGRSRQNPRLVTRDDDPPYYEQEVKKVEATELDKCREICKGTCRNGFGVSTTKPNEPSITSVESSVSACRVDQQYRAARIRYRSVSTAGNIIGGHTNRAPTAQNPDQPLSSTACLTNRSDCEYARE